MLLFTGGALAVGLVIVAFALLQQAPGAPATRDLVPPGVAVPAGLSDGRTLGRADAPVTVEIWSDFQCPACRKLAVEVEPEIVSIFVIAGTAKLVYRDVAFLGQRGTDKRYDESVQAAAGARCAADQGRFWEMHDWLFANWDGENKGAYGAGRLRDIAAAAGLDLAAFDACMTAGDKQAAVRSETQEGFASGYNSTPTLVVNGYSFSGVPTVAQLSQLIRDAADLAQAVPDLGVLAAVP